ncbi:MAG: thioredoxin domain-containing protein [Planctomycetota bacterium]|nr:thioredoxin domain-containing protein [Planctomycetota bacterium]
MANRLAEETSPYLLQHSGNPVDWYPWGSEALTKAKEENRPIFLSIGYSACHWCHVMEHESFENPEIAQFLNQNFVSIKVDREERPDLDQLYMQAVMALQGGQGGWPLSAFLNPAGHVFFGGTYWPPFDSRGMPGFDRVLRRVLEAFQKRREQVDEQSAKVTAYLNAAAASPVDAAGQIFEPGLLLRVGEHLERVFDFQNGGFGRAPKFPHSMDLQLLMQLGHREAKAGDNVSDSRWIKMVCLNLDKMALGGIYDHLGGGFARYSVDEKWLVPHFEKMLYDNGLLMEAYLDAYTITGDPLYFQRTLETFDYQLKYMIDPGGGFHSTEDADSEGVEGKFYVWNPEEIFEVLGETNGRLFCAAYDVTDAGNFEGKNILNLKSPLESFIAENGLDDDFLETMAGCRQQLLEVRDRRTRPGKDDKILVSWNALMIQALAKGSLVLDQPGYLESAVAAAEFIDSSMVQSDGVGLFHTFREGQSKINAYLDDYSYFINALLTLYETTGDLRWLKRAIELCDYVIHEFHDDVGQAFFFTGRSSERLIAHSKEFQDSSVPSGNSIMVLVLSRLYRLTGREEFRVLAHSTASCAAELILSSPGAAAQMVCGIDQLLSRGQEIVICSDAENQRDVLRAIFSSYHPNRIVCPIYEDSNPVSSLIDEALWIGREMVEGKPTVFVCNDNQCELPLVGMEQINQFFGNHSP